MSAYSDIPELRTSFDKGKAEATIGYDDLSSTSPGSSPGLAQLDPQV